MPAATLATAMKYIKLLWGDRAHENLMKSINPLGQLEISMDNGRGGKETRYLQFDFHRVVGPKGASSTYCARSATSPPTCCWRKELQESQENANAQVDMMVGMLHVDPLQLGSFLDTTETGLQLINAILKEPARTDAEFRKKLGGLVPRAALDQGRGLGPEPDEHRQPRAHPRGHGERAEEEGRALRQRLPADGAEAR